MEENYNYLKYRGKCKEFCDELVAKDPTLTLVRGHYWCPIWNSEEQHWWCKDQEGNIVDPTKLQFPSVGCGIYTEFNGIVTCSECGKEIPEEEADIQGNYIFCSYTCYGRCVGF
jgi:hypothetical protein